MDWEYSRETYSDDCTAQERFNRTEEILDFANMVFSVAYGGTDFGWLLPKAYAPQRSGLPIHHMIRSRGRGRIRALIDLYPLDLQLRGRPDRIRAVYVGTVAVHPNDTGRGYMTALMQRAVADARRQGCALMILDGARHRYQYFGFERAGIRYDFHIETNNIEHSYAKLCMKDTTFCFQELEEGSPYLDRLYGLYCNRLVTARSRGDFWLSLQSYNASAYAVLRCGESVGYVCLSEDRRSLTEFEIMESGDLCGVLHDLMESFELGQLRVSVGMDETEKIEQLEYVCNSCSASTSHQIRILDYEAALAFLMNWKRQYAAPATGEYVVGIRDAQEGCIENYLLSVTEDKASVTRTEREADTVFDGMELIRILTTPLCFVQPQRGLGNKIKNAPAGWFPLPFYLPEADTF